MEEHTSYFSSNTSPSLVRPVGTRWSSDRWRLTALNSQYGDPPLANGEWVEEDGPHYDTDDDGFTYMTAHSVTTVSLQCVANCKNFDCSQPCNDGNDCTDDTCVPGRSVHRPGNPTASRPR